MLLPGKSAIAFLTLGVLATLGAIRAADLSWRRAEVVRTAEARAGNLVLHFHRAHMVIDGGLEPDTAAGAPAIVECENNVTVLCEVLPE